MDKYLLAYKSRVIKNKGKLVYEYNPLVNLRNTKGEVKDFETTNLNFDLSHPVDILCQQAYDGSTNLILNDGKNIPRLINTRFTPRENNTYERVDREGNTDTNIYDEDEFDIDTSLFKRYNSIPKITFLYVSMGGNMKVGNYTFYFKLADADGNETDFVGESGIVTLHIGPLNDPHNIRGGSQDENSNKSVSFTLSKIDSAYDYVSVYYVRHTGDNYTGTETGLAYHILKNYRTLNGNCFITITGNEEVQAVDTSEINIEHFVAASAKTLAICQNMLFLGNVTKATIDYAKLKEVSQWFLPYYEEKDEKDLIGCLQYDYNDAVGKYGYYNTQNIYNYVGYWPEELYRFGVVYIMNDNSLSPVFNIRGIKNLPEAKETPTFEEYTKGTLSIDADTLYINTSSLENAAGVVLFPIAKPTKDGNLAVYGLKIVHPEKLTVGDETITYNGDEDTNDPSFDDVLKSLKVKGFFFVRQKRIPTILAQAMTMAVDKEAGIPLVYAGKDGTEDLFLCEGFTNSKGELDQDSEYRVIFRSEASLNKTAICPEYELNQPYYNNIFTGTTLPVRPMTGELSIINDAGRHFFTSWNGSFTPPTDASYSMANIIGVPDSAPAVCCDDFTFRALAGSPEDIKFEKLYKSEEPTQSNFSHEKRKKHRWLKALKVTGLALAIVGTAVAAVYTGGASLAATAALGAAMAGTVAAGAVAATVAVGSTVVKSASSIKNYYTTGTGNTTDNKVFIVRGAYGAFLGLTSNTALKYNLIINIYVPGYLNISAISLFNIRIENSDPYYAISDRFQLGRDTTIPTLYRGDCFISQFTHRINRNFQDPDAPNNDKIVNTSTWIDNWNEDDGASSSVNRGDVNAVKLGWWVTFKCYTSMNLAMRDWDSRYPSETALTGHNRGFYPLFSMSADGNNKVPDSTCYNAAFSTSTGDKANLILPLVPYIKNVFQTRVAYSHPAATDAFKNGLRLFDMISYRDYPNLYGGLMKLVTYGESLVAVFEHAIALILVNRNALIPTDDGTTIAIGATKVIPDLLIILSDEFGSLWPESVIFTGSAVYGVDTVAKKIWCYAGQQVECISDFKVQKFLNENITLSERELSPIIGVRNVKTHYNAYKKDVLFTFYDNLTGFEEKVWNLCYNEYLKEFITFYSWVPSYSENIDNIFFSFDRTTSKWISKLATSCKKSADADGIVVDSTDISLWLNNSTPLSVVNRVTDSGSPTFTVERDNFGWYNNFTTATPTDNLGNIVNYLLVCTHPEFFKSELFKGGVILLNIKVSYDTVKDDTTTNHAVYYSLLFLTYEPVELTTSFWKHGHAGLIDTAGIIKPCFWYGEQHPFEFEFVVGNNSAYYKLFSNMSILSNNVRPESLHYEIVGDTYSFAPEKKAMYFRQEATKAFLQYNGCDILYNHNTFDTEKFGKLTPYMANPKARVDWAYSNTYKATLLPLLYMRLDTFNEVQDFYKEVTSDNKDYPNLTGGEVVWDELFNSFALVNHVKVKDVKDFGRIGGNAEYRNDHWDFNISPFLYYLWNETPWDKDKYPNPIITLDMWPKDLAMSDTPECPKDLTNLGQDFKLNGLNPVIVLRKEFKLMDTYMRVRVRYDGSELVIIRAINTTYNMMN